MAHTARAAPTVDAPNLPGAPLNERVLTVPVDDATPPVRLQVTIFMPARGGPFPLALVNHGASHDPANAPRVADQFIPYYFLSRGYAVAMPMMRGYAGSSGHWRPHGCDVSAIGLDAARDIRKVLDVVKQQPGIDASHIVVAGKSMGGWNTLAFGSLNPADVKGLLDFAGGVKEGDCETPDASLISAAAQLGARTRLRSIWFYGDNDSIFATGTWQQMYTRYTAAGGRAELVDYGAFQRDAHAMTASGAGLPLWVQKADAFLRSIGMPGSETNPEYLPGHAPASTAYANVNDLSAIPYLSDDQKGKLYREFLAAPLPRAIAIGMSNGSLTYGGFDPANRALKRCYEIAQYCQLYAVDNTVVWPRLAAAPPATKFAPLAEISAVPYLNPQGRAAYGKFLAMRRPRAFAIAPDGAWGASSGLDPINSALVQCANGHADCKLYAVDSDVVWNGK
ncbi:alpha/beta hydrolase family protein [Paraburkholderia humisilvae]|uniref:alpha/beta hydrolase family protein n=1 Tax=Paraburkholderia humisilvae TaxID=627669 RepID=UPI001C2DFCA9|nr:CocE/NonD family hydrolase [Paraburkholderia humisilvae]